MITVSRTLNFSTIIAGLMIPLTIWDMFAEYPWQPFAGQFMFDVCFLVASGLVLYMAWDVWQENNAPTRRISTETTTQRSVRKTSLIRSPSRRTKRSDGASKA